MWFVGYGLEPNIATPDRRTGGKQSDYRRAARAAGAARAAVYTCPHSPAVVEGRAQLSSAVEWVGGQYHGGWPWGWQHFTCCAHAQPLSWDGGIWGVALPGGRATVDHTVCGGACTRDSAFAMHAHSVRGGDRGRFLTPRTHVFRPLPDAPTHRRTDGRTLFLTPRTDEQHYCSSNL